MPVAPGARYLLGYRPGLPLLRFLCKDDKLNANQGMTENCYVER